MSEPSTAVLEHHASSRYRTKLFGELSGRFREVGVPVCEDYPLIIAIHGGGFDSRYFDVPGASLFERAGLLGLPVLAPDRPGYGESPDLAQGQPALVENAAFLRNAIDDAWRHYRGAARGIVVVGHSIGGAIALLIAAEALSWPLLGLCISGLALRTPSQSKDAIATLPPIPKILQPDEAKDPLMFGPPGSFDVAVRTASHVANTPVPTRELVEIVTTWHETLRELAPKVRVPIHYRQAQLDALWLSDQREINEFTGKFHGARRVDAAMVPGVGHCIDFHRSGAALQIQQLGFALQCAAEAALA